MQPTSKTDHNVEKCCYAMASITQQTQPKVQFIVSHRKLFLKRLKQQQEQRQHYHHPQHQQQQKV